MQKIQVKAEVDIESLLAQLDTDELEDFVREAAAVLTQRKSGDKKNKEVELLQRLNEECALPEAHWNSFRELLIKRSAFKLSDEEAALLEYLIREEEALRLKRVQILGELAQLKGISLEKIVDELGIHPIEIE